jgi:hypothetical protein
MEFGVLFPVLFLVSCALMMTFMMRGHGHGGHGKQAHQHAVGDGSCRHESEKPEAERRGR